MRITETEIQGLKAQEAKDLCVELLRKLNASKGGPISPGEVQLQELQYELKLKEAEAADRREREAHERRMTEMQLEIERERALQSQGELRADQVRQEYAQIIQQVAASQEKLSVQLERATREHNVRVEIMQNDFQATRQQLENDTQQLTERRDALRGEIGRLVDLQQAAENVEQLQHEIEQRRVESQRSLRELEEEIQQAEFQKTKQLNQLRREQELAVVELESQHRRLVLDNNLKVVDQILSSIQMIRVRKDEWDTLNRRVTEDQATNEQRVQELLAQARDEVRRSYNITSTEPMDVTDLYYRQRSLHEVNEAYCKQVHKLEAEIQHMREHIEKESTRIAAAIEAARVNIQNTIEPGVKR